MGLGRTQKRKTMKKILLLLLCVLVNSTRLFAGDHVVNMTLTIGVPHTFTPIDDIGVPSSKVAHKNIWLGQSSGPDDFTIHINGENGEVTTTAFFTTPQKNEGTVFSWWDWRGDTQKIQGYYYTYTLIPNQTGAYTATTTIYWTNKKQFDHEDEDYFYKEKIIYNITVVDVTSIALPSTLPLTVGDAYTLSPIIVPANATPVLTWTSSNSSVASVDNNGKVEALSEGTATITCMANNGVSASCVVTVKPRMNYLYSADFSGGAGGHVTVPILMKNDINVAGFQFDLTMPEGVTLTLKEDGTADATVTERTSTHTLSGTTTASGAVRFTAFSTKNALVTGTEGAVMNIRFDVDKNMAHGDYDVKFTNVQLTQKNGSDLTTVYAPDFTLKMSVGAIALGDVNADGVVNVTDAISIIGYIVEERPTWFTESVADVNGDGFIDVADVVSVIDIVLSQE